MRTTRVKDIMTDVVETLQIGDTLATARRQIQRGGIHHLPVVNDEEGVIGLITYHRLLEAWIEGDRAYRDSGAQAADQIPIETVMEKDVLTVDVETSAADAARLLDKNRFGSLPVTQDEKLVGIVTAADFVRVALRYLERELHQL
jgi:CBS domain-containing membrane protein